jgi:neutral cholesterol ester hydrolase 1
VTGDSAGGYLTAAVVQALHAKRSSLFPSIKLQVLLYPVMQMVDVYTPSYQQNAYDPILPREAVVWYITNYAFGHQKYNKAILYNNHTSAEFKKFLAEGPMNLKLIPERFQTSPNYVQPNLDFGDSDLWSKVKDVLTNPAFSPLLATDLTGLPAAIVLACQFDVLRDEALMYASRLEQAGVSVTRILAQKGFHGILSLVASLPEAREVYEQVIDKIRLLL